MINDRHRAVSKQPKNIPSDLCVPIASALALFLNRHIGHGAMDFAIPGKTNVLRLLRRYTINPPFATDTVTFFFYAANSRRRIEC